MEFDFSPADVYRQYVESVAPDLPPTVTAKLHGMLEATQWEDPQSPLDFNNVAVVTLVMAEQCDEPSMRGFYLDMALEGLTGQSAAHPLGEAHKATVFSLLGETQTATQIAFPVLIGSLNRAFRSSDDALGLIYFPQSWKATTARRREILTALLMAQHSDRQALILLAEVLCQSQLAFYNASGMRFLRLAAQILPDSPSTQLKLGLAHLMNNQVEGLLNLHQAQQRSPASASILQALYLAYRTLGQLELAQGWLEQAKACAQAAPQALDWQWVTVGADRSFTYLPFDHLLLAVEPSFHSIVTSVLLAEGDWFESEIEFWRHQLQPGMTVIDVGANAGVYTFSAAQCVGASGQVLAVEPFSGCVQQLEETCRVNQLPWVKVCAGAASDRNGQARLALHSASELNEIVEGEGETEAGSFEAVACFTLDSLVEQEGLTRVDFLKIDAEGHEIKVLQGSDRMLRAFRPRILYENISGQGSNLAVAEFLEGKGYQLFRYQPYVEELIPVESHEYLQNRLNVIAIPREL